MFGFRRPVSERVHLTIAGLGIDLSWEGARRAKEDGEVFFRDFLSDGHRNGRTPELHLERTVRLHLRCGDLPDVQPDRLIFDAADRNRWRLSRQNGRLLFEFFHTRQPHPKIQVALMAPDFRSGELYRRPDRIFPRRAWSLNRLMRPFGELLMVNLLSQGRGVLVHGLGIADRGNGILFVGRSGAGKSTLAQLYAPHRDVTILGDERLVVTQAEGQFWMSGTPWPGEAMTVAPDTVPLCKIFFLEHGKRNELVPDTFVNLFGLLFQQLFLPFWNGEALSFALGFAEELLRSLPAYRLPFVNDARVIEFLRSQR